MRSPMVSPRFSGIISLLLLTLPVCYAHADILTVGTNASFDFTSYGEVHYLVYDEPLPWTSEVLSANGLTATAVGGTYAYLTADGPGPYVATGVLRGTGLSVAHSALQEVLATTRLEVSSGINYDYIGDFQIGHSAVAYTGEVAPGDSANVLITAKYEHLHNPGHFSYLTIFGQEYTNETNEPISIFDSMPGGIDFHEEHLSLGAVERGSVYVRIDIKTNRFPEFHQPTGVTWVKVDPGFGAGDPSLDLVSILDATAVPEPSTITLLGMGGLFAIICTWVRRRRERVRRTAGSRSTSRQVTVEGRFH